MNGLSSNFSSKRNSINSILEASKVKYPVLSAQSNTGIPGTSLRDLEKKWGAFKNHFGIYEAGYDAYKYIGRLLNAREFRSNITEFYQLEDNKELVASLNAKNNDFFFMDIQPKYIETKLQFTEMQLILNFGDNTQSMMDGETIVKSVFPQFKIPTKWEAVKRSPEAQKTKYTSLAYSVGEDLIREIPLEDILNIKPKFTSANDKFPKESLTFSLSKDYFKNNFNKIASLKLTLKQSDVSLSKYHNSGETTGELTSGTEYTTIPVEIELILRWPIQFAYYVTCSTNTTDFIPFLFFQYVTWHRLVYGANRTRGGGMAPRPSRINHLGNILYKNEKEKQAGRNPKPRSNSEGFVVLGVGEPALTGKIIYVPNNANNVAQYLNQIKNCYDGTSKRFDLTKIKLHSMPILTDWYNDKLAYLRETGVGLSSSDISGIQTIDLTGSVPLDNITIATNLNKNVLDEEIIDEFRWLLSLCKKFIQKDWKDAKPSHEYTSSEYLKTKGLDKPSVAYLNENPLINTIQDTILGFQGKVTWANIGGYPLIYKPIDEDDVSETKTPSKFKVIRICCNILKDLFADLLKNLDHIDIAYSRRTQDIQFLLHAVAFYADNYSQYSKEYNDNIAKNTIKPISDAVYNNYIANIDMPNLTGVEVLLPHQVETFIQSDFKSNAILNTTSMGGGKSICQIRDIAKLIYDKNIKRALVIVPNNLVRNWVNEILKFSNNKINAFALTIQSVRRLQFTYTKNPDPIAKPDYKMLKSLIESMPINTIFVTSYRFLMNDRDEIVYGSNIITRLYIAEFMRDIGFDLVAMDESQNVKNLNSLSTLGVSIVASSAKYKRELSGTPVTDTITDLVGQSGVMSPQALGSLARFQERYGAIEGNSEWRPDAPQLITSDLKPYIQRIVNKREKWAFILPFLNEEFHSVNMTEKQEEFYTSLLKKSIEDLRKKNPRLYAKMIDGNEKDSRSVEMGLNTHFQSVEQFLYAPDSNEAFTRLEGLKPEDLMSPKVPKIVEILDKHFSGYTDARGRKFEANKHKVIIFSHRVKTASHIMKYLPDNYRKMAVEYQAGDFKALQSFLKDNNILILVASELSINTGENFQIASRMIRIETLWSPGSQEQATARIWRPAFKEGSERQQVFLDWVFSNKSLEVAKIGRLISKIITKTRYDQQDNTAFVKDKFIPDAEFKQTYGSIIPQIGNSLPVNEMLGELRLIKMNNETLLKLNDVNQLREYFAYYALILRWEVNEFNKMSKDKRYSTVVSLPKSAYKEIPNSKSIPYTPRVPGVESSNFDPQNKLEFKPISIVENEADNFDEDDEEIIEINPVREGQLVNTEFGYGNVTKILQTDVWVDIKGIGEVKCPKATVWIIGNSAAEKDIQRRLNKLGDAGDPKLPDVVMNLLKSSKNTPPTLGRPKVNEEVEEEEDEGDFKTKPAQKEPKVKFDQFDHNEDEEIEEICPIWASIIDTQIALTATANEESLFLAERQGWRKIPSYYAIHIPNIVAFEKVEALLTSKFAILPKYIDNLNYYKTMLRNKSLEYSKTNAINQTMRFFNIDEHTTIKKGSLRPYPLIWNDKFYIAFDSTKNQSAQDVVRKVKALGVSGVHIYDQQSLYAHVFSNKEDAIAELTALNKKIINPEYKKSLKILQDMKQKSAPTTTTFKTNLQLKPKITPPVVKIEPVKHTPKPVEPSKTVNVQQEKKKPFSFNLNLRGLGKIK